MTINRFSSRRSNLGQNFLTVRLQNAQAYDRIAGYFRSSLLAIVADQLETVSGMIRVVCNSDLAVEDVETAKAANNAMRREWCEAEPEQRFEASKPQLQRLYELLRSGKMQVRVLPRERFGLEHGKAGVITLADGTKTAFMGSVNESLSGWKLNYELMWEDTSPDAIEWVEAEFVYLWNHKEAVPLADFVIEDIGRIAQRTVIPTVEVWRENPEAAAVAIESPVYRREYGLWEHQKYFVDKAFKAHLEPFGARFVLADMVGLGKTVQLALSALLMALSGSKPVLIIVPKALLWQWQSEIYSLLAMPSAVWNGRQWVDETEFEYPALGPQEIKKCPRRVGIISQGLISSKSEVVEYLKLMSFECVIVDEAHRARRKNLGPGCERQPADPNNLLAFLQIITTRTTSMLLATATPVQIHPIEAWDLLNVLAGSNNAILGDSVSMWRKPAVSLPVVTGAQQLPHDDGELWRWVRNPLPPASEGRDFANIRRTLNIEERIAVVRAEWWERLKESDKDRVRRQRAVFGVEHNPFIRHIVRRTRDYLEQKKDENGDPYLKAVNVVLRGESDREAIMLPPYLRDAYQRAESFCELLSERVDSTGFLKTLLLRRLGSTVRAGMITAQKMLTRWGQADDEEEADDTEDSDPRQATTGTMDLTEAERSILREFIAVLEANRDPDPKYAVVSRLLTQEGWLGRGCIIFSQYYDSIWWLAEQLTRELPDVPIGIYAGGQRSGVMLGGVLARAQREDLKRMVQKHELRLLLGTDAASEGLNLQKLGSLINLDLPWNPTRLEQRKGRIQRIGQEHETIWLYNMRYKDSVEDRVHALLSERLAAVHAMFGQIPDVLQDVWVAVAQRNDEQVKQTIDAIPTTHPFTARYHEDVEKVPWETCANVLNAVDIRFHLSKGW